MDGNETTVATVDTSASSSMPSATAQNSRVSLVSVATHKVSSTTTDCLQIDRSTNSNYSIILLGKEEKMLGRVALRAPTTGGLMYRRALSILTRNRSAVLAQKIPSFVRLAASAAVTQPVTAPTSAVEWPESHASHFKFERYWAAGMLPLLPAAYFIHGPVMDFALTVAIAMHIHWGVYGVVQDYGRPFVIGQTLASAARVAVYLMTVSLFIGLLHFNYNDVGLTKAFELVWSL